MFISASEALILSDSTESNISNFEAMPALIKSSKMENFLLSSKRSADSESASTCSTMSLGAGPLWWSWCPWGNQGLPAATTANFPHPATAMGRSAVRQDAVRRPAALHFAWGFAWGARCPTGSGRGTVEMSTCCAGILQQSSGQGQSGPHLHVPRIRGVIPYIAEHPAATGSRQRVYVV